jgi:hypothetical protein
VWLTDFDSVIRRFESSRPIHSSNSAESKKAKIQRLKVAENTQKRLTVVAGVFREMSRNAPRLLLICFFDASWELLQKVWLNMYRYGNITTCGI